ncbi:hypothetical protein K469DRAFT_695867 [Zopfia rhizophila CBS 207.26]|uniref:Uncharacterized protein n=1 Tax=Zopfia rhizophila CBS 207.26 TaxID=1314779 RepID=A0A6A6EI47_9PEZI|nr:hypothetical protein K469DRAFT_695867 [Zopfia rhizophila CBS 207.26]
MDVPNSPASIPQGSTGAHAGSISAVAVKTSFHFLNLPRDVRLMVYEYLLVKAFKPILNADGLIFWIDWVVPLSILLSCRAANLKMRDLLARKPPNQKVQIVCGNVKGLEEVNIQLELLRLTLHDDIARRQQEESEGNAKKAPRSETKFVPSELSLNLVPSPDDFVFKTIHQL